MQRIDGFLDLNELDDGSFNASSYSKDQYWLNIEDKKYYYKISNYPYHELICYFLGKRMAIEVTPYDLATYKGNFGVISKSYCKDGYDYVPGYKMLEQYYRESKKIMRDMGLRRKHWINFFTGPQFVCMNNLETITQAIDYMYKAKYSEEQIFKCNYKMVKQFCFWILTGQFDKSSHNWELELSNDSIDVVPVFDNEASFPTSQQVIPFSVGSLDNMHSLTDILTSFLRISSSEYIEVFLDLYNKSNELAFEESIKEVESQIGEVIPTRVKNELYDGYMYNMELIRGVLEDFDLIKKVER